MSAPDFAPLHPGYASFEELKRDPEFLEDSADAIVTMVSPKGAMAAAE